MQKQNRSPIDTGCRQHRKVGDIGVPKDWCDIAQDQFFCRILSEGPNPVNADKLSEESYKEAHDILSMAIKQFDISKVAIHRVCILMFQALFGSTHNQSRGALVSCPSTLQQTGP
jgi:hypothetical protein